MTSTVDELARLGVVQIPDGVAAGAGFGGQGAGQGTAEALARMGILQDTSVYDEMPASAPVSAGSWQPWHEVPSDVE